MICWYFFNSLLQIIYGKQTEKSNSIEKISKKKAQNQNSNKKKQQIITVIDT